MQMSEILVAAPHPDDETLGCAGTLLRHRDAGDRLHWLIFTELRREYGFSAAAIATRDAEIQAVAKQFSFVSVHNLGLAPAGLDSVPMSLLVERLAAIFVELKPEVVYVPHRGDAHSDHRIAFEALASCTKWFRYPSVRRVLSYETLSETDASLTANVWPFNPTVFVDVGSFLEEKITIMKLYRSELRDFPFPRSECGLRSLAALRGIASGFVAAEGFMLLRERI